MSYPMDARIRATQRVQDRDRDLDTCSPCETDPVAMPQVALLLNEVEGVLSRADDTFSKLRNRLSPVTYDKPMAANALPPDKSPDECELATRLRSVRNHILNLEERINGTITALQI